MNNLNSNNEENIQTLTKSGSDGRTISIRSCKNVQPEIRNRHKIELFGNMMKLTMYIGGISSVSSKGCVS